ncbi:hypothetical protein EI94DRAFT_1785841 [Lactarius quietus]|nr:hypothetical protein EI94DRAFT_1785841 [Lactarius quietus]
MSADTPTGVHAYQAFSDGIWWSIYREDEGGIYLLNSQKMVLAPFLVQEVRADKVRAKRLGQGDGESNVQKVRRDHCRHATAIEVETRLQKMLIDRDVKGTKDFRKNIVFDLLQNK